MLFERDVGDGFVDESARDAFGFVFKFVVVKAARQETLTCQGNRHTAGVNGYPSPAPTVLQHKQSSRFRTGGVEDEIAGVGSHKEATFEQLSNCRLNYIDCFLISKT